MSGKKERESGQVRRVTSITRKLHRSFILKKLGICVRTDVLLFLLSAASYLTGMEFSRNGWFFREADRALTLGASPGSLIYKVTDAGGTILLARRVDPELKTACFILLGLFILQLVGIIFAYNREDRKIRKILDPLNELALRADELSRISFSEDKYQLIEDAITQIKPEDATKLSLGDSDLAGVEAAMNNLLLRMRETYQQQARFVNDASHELRTPIAVIEGYANLLDRWGKTDEKILEESISAIRNESEHMKHLVEQLLFLARGDSGKNTVQKQKTNLAEVVREVYEESFMIDEKHPYRFRPGEDVSVMADSGMIKQAVRILTDNAAKYTNEGDEIILSCGKTENGEPYIQVQDTGIGMAEADVQHMFERFYRSDEARAYKGTGLGLSIAKWIVDKHGGHFEILSRTGLGTRIRIIFGEEAA